MKLQIVKGIYTSSTGEKCDAVKISLGNTVITMADLSGTLYHFSGSLGFIEAEEKKEEPQIDLKKYFGSNVQNILINFKD